VPGRRPHVSESAPFPGHRVAQLSGDRTADFHGIRHYMDVRHSRPAAPSPQRVRTVVVAGSFLDSECSMSFPSVIKSIFDAAPKWHSSAGCLGRWQYLIEANRIVVYV
jgi:hypothetical protein